MYQTTVAQRILVHLSLFSRLREEYECPDEVTQKGISKALGLSRSHVALELKKLLEEEHAVTRLAHVTDARSRRKVYFLTLSGERMAASMREKARDMEARWIDHEGVRQQGTGAELLHLCRGLDKPMTLVYLGILSGEVVDLREPVGPPATTPAPDIVGRSVELEQLRGWLRDGPLMLLLTGLPGIGKTALARGLFREVSGGLWIDVYPFHSPTSLLSSIAHGLASVGRSRLLSYLKGRRPDYTEAGLLLSREASGTVLFFDDVTSSKSASRALRLFLDSPPPGCRVLLTARRQPDFLKTEDLLAEGTREIRLGGLDLDETRELLRHLGHPEGDAKRIHKLTGGHPLLVKLTVATSAQPKAVEVEASFLDEVLAELDPKEEEILAMASVYRKPFTMRALGPVSIRSLRSLVRAGLLTEDRGRYDVHDVLAPLIRRHSGEGLREAHLQASEFRRSQAEWTEALYHLAAAGHTDQLLRLAEERLDDILERGQASEILELLEGVSSREGGATLLYLKARAQDYQGQWTQALLTLEEGMRQASSDLRIHMFLLKGRLHSKRGEFSDAEEAFEAAIDLSVDEERELELGMARYGLGIVHRKRGNMERALTFMQGAMDIFEAVNAEADLGRAEMEMGVIQLQANSPEEAVEWFRRSKPLLSSRRVDSAYLNNNLGIAFSKLSRMEESLHAFEESVRLAEEAGMVRAEGYALANASDLYVDFGKIDKALDYCEKSLQIFTQLQDPVMISACHANRAKAERATGNLDAAKRLYDESLRTLEGTQAPYSLAARWLEASELYEEMGKSSKARELRSKALSVLKEDRSPPTGAQGA